MDPRLKNQPVGQPSRLSAVSAPPTPIQSQSLLSQAATLNQRGLTPQQIRSNAATAQAIAQLQQVLSGSSRPVTSINNSPPHQTLTPSLASLMGAQAVALLNGGQRSNLDGGVVQSQSHVPPAGLSPLMPRSAAVPGATPTSSMSPLGLSKKRGRLSSDPDDKGKRFRSGSQASGSSVRGPAGGYEKLSKGLRHFSWRVCEKVQQKKITTYNEVADELVHEMAEAERSTNESAVDHKNIRRRVYDALNVLMAMNIISKEKKEIRWIGLPTNSLQECQHLEEQLSHCEERVKEKKQKLNDLLIKVLSFKNLIKRNREQIAQKGTPPPNSAITLPFFIVHADKETYIDCSISNDKRDYVFQFDQPFSVQDDLDVLRSMGMALGLDNGSCTPENLQKAKALLPKAFEPYLTEMATGPPEDSSMQQPDEQISKESSLLASPNLVSTHPGSGVPPQILSASPLISGLQASSSNKPSPSSPAAAFNKFMQSSSSPLAKPLTSSPARTPVSKPTTPGKVVVQPVSPNVKRVQAQVLPQNLSVLSPLVKHFQAGYSHLSSQNILNVLAQADPNLLNLAQSLLTTTSPTTSSVSTVSSSPGQVQPPLLDASVGSSQSRGLMEQQKQPSQILPLSESSQSTSNSMTRSSSTL